MVLCYLSEVGVHCELKWCDIMRWFFVVVESVSSCTCVVEVSKICDIRYWIIRKSLLTDKLTKSLIIFKYIVNCWCPSFYIMCAPCYVSSDEKNWKVQHGKTGQDIQCQVKWLSLSMWLQGTLWYMLCIIFWCPENCDIRQTFGLGGWISQILL
jgi:hypothetical protein